MNRAGDAVVTWGYGAYNISSNAVVARSRPAGGPWGAPQIIASGQQEQPDAGSVGAHGAAVIGSGPVWSGPVTISPATQRFGSSSALKTDDAGDATFVYSGQDSRQVFAVRGALATQSWSAPNLALSTPQQNSVVLLDVASNGNAIVAVTPSNANVQATTRTGPNCPWSALAVIPGATIYGVSVIGVAINPAGQAVLTWTIGGINWSLYANYMS